MPNQWMMGRLRTRCLASLDWKAAGVRVFESKRFYIIIIMRTIIDNKCLASWAVFRRLSENGKRNRYDVLREFIKATIYKHSLREFTSSELTEMVNSDYAFKLKNAVIAFALQPFKFEKDGGKYLCNPDDFVDYKQVVDEIAKETAQSNSVLDQLYAYVEGQRKRSLSDEEKRELVQSFINYILDNGYSDINAKEISSFVVAFKKGSPISNPLDDILEGVVSYTGMVFDNPASASSRWKTEMYVYLDTEIIFHMAGYNGELYKQLFDDFYSFVKEINNDSTGKGQKKKIHLRYFAETEVEIDQFFERAKDVVNNKIRRMPWVTAMKSITDGCACDADVVEKKGQLIAQMEQNGIHLDPNPTDYYTTDNYALNIEDHAIVEKFHQENPKTAKKDILDSLVSLSHVNVLRKGKSDKTFENLRYVLLTDNYITKRLSRMDEIRKEGDRPLSTDLYFITNRMWYRLGKAFGDGETPRVFDVINKARIILSSQVNSSVAAKYEDLVARMDKNEITSEAAMEVLYQLRNEVRNPEDIDGEAEVEEALVAINETDIDRYAEQEAFRRKQEEATRQENEQLKKDKEQLTTRMDEVGRENKVVHQRNKEIEAEKKSLEQTLGDRKREEDDLKEELAAAEQRAAVAEQKASYAEAHATGIACKDFCRKKRKAARWNVFLVVLFLGAASVYSWAAEKYKWTFLPVWIQTIAVYLMPQIILMVRASIVKISFWRSFAIAFGGGKKKLTEEFMESLKS